MSAAIALFRHNDDGTQSIVAHTCGKCGIVAASPNMFVGTDGERLRMSEAQASEHCGPWYCACGDERSRFATTCDQCRRQEQAYREASTERSRLAKAKRVEIDDVEEGYFYEDGEYLDRDTLLDKIEEGDAPSYVWACTSRGLEIDAADVIESAISDHHEDAHEWLDAGAEKALQGAIDSWIAAFASNVRSFEPDFSRVVILDDGDLP